MASVIAETMVDLSSPTPTRNHYTFQMQIFQLFSQQQQQFAIQLAFGLSQFGWNPHSNYTKSFIQSL